MLGLSGLVGCTCYPDVGIGGGSVRCECRTGCVVECVLSAATWVSLFSPSFFWVPGWVGGVGLCGGCVFGVGCWVTFVVDHCLSPTEFVGGGYIQRLQRERPLDEFCPVLSFLFRFMSWLGVVTLSSEVGLVSSAGLSCPHFGW